MTDLEFVDAHVHFWQPRANDWYPMLRTAMPDLVHDHLPEHYRAGTGSVRVTGLVHVSAVTAPRAVLDETRWLDGLRRDTGVPTAIIGTVDPAAPFEVIEKDLLAQAESPAFRGVRVLFGLDPAAATTAALFRLLGERGWVYDLVARPADAAAHLPAVERAPETAFVLEHAGWPEGETAEDFRRWRTAMAALAAFGNVDCKISGLPMALGTMDPARLRPWVETCLELFGVERCLVGGNFPVDGLAGSFTRLMDAYQEVTASLSDAERRAVFADNARRRYRLG